MDVIAEQQLLATYVDGITAKVVLRVGRPYNLPDKDAACPIEGEGLRIWKGSREVFGVDTWQAILLAFRFFRSMLEREIEYGTVFCLEEGEEPMSIEEMFPFGNS